MVGFRAMKKAVNDNQVPKTITAKQHYNDIIHCAMILYNNICEGIRGGFCKTERFVDIVLKTSNFIKGGHTMRERFSKDEVFLKGALLDFYFGERKEYAPPIAVKDFKTFRKRDNRVKDIAVDIAIKMYLLSSKDASEVV